MNKQKMTLVGVTLSVLLLLLVAFLVRSNLKKPEHIVLPPEESPGMENQGGGEETGLLNRIEIRPDTVQSAIESLSRASEYTRSFTIERYWQGGHGVTVTNVFASAGWLRLDSVDSNADVRHVILSDDGTVYIWYNSERRYFSGASAFAEDEEQGILTYEDVLSLPVERIALADYRSFEGVNCIYVETSSDENGYSERYWVSTADGLLTAAERLAGEELVYRMVTTQAKLEMPSDAFVLPDGTELYKAETNELMKGKAKEKEA